MLDFDSVSFMAETAGRVAVTAVGAGRATGAGSGRVVVLGCCSKPAA